MQLETNKESNQLQSTILPQCVKHLCARDPRNLVHCKRRDALGSQCLYHLFILRRIEKRNDGSALAEGLNFIGRGIYTRSAHFKDDIALRPQDVPIDNDRSSFNVFLVGELGGLTRSFFHQDPREALLQQQGDILRRDGHPALIGERLARNAYSKCVVRGACSWRSCCC